MADTSAQLRAEEWVISHFLRSHFRGKTFSSRKLDLTWGGSFAFDAVSADGEIAALISTSKARTASGKPGVGKFHKLRSDVLFLLYAKGVERRVMVFTEGCMFEQFAKERESGRFPPETQIQLLLANLPDAIQKDVSKSRKRASKETTPQRRRRK